ncbi:MAG TPA: M56 family metallopeptidase, partial [Rhodanobacteraceae bacterium]
MTDLLLQMLLGVTLGLAFVWLARRPACRVFGAAPAFTLWLLPVLMAFAPLLPRSFVISNTWALPAITATARALPADIPSASSFPLAWLPIAIWAAGASVAFCRLALQYLRVLRAIAPMPQAWRAMIAETAPELRASRVRVHEAGPAVLWAWRTRVLLPPDFDTRFDNTAQRLVLHHELTHVRRGDALWLLIAELACAVLWFHPLAWLALPRFRLDQELACDERTLRSLKEGAVHYARALLDSVAVQVLPALIPWLAEPQLKERIAMISNKRPGALRRRFGFFAVAAILTSGVLIAGAEMPAQAATHVSKTSTPPSVDITKKNANPPKYPEEALKNRQQGTVVLDVTVDARGNVLGVVVDQ